MVKNFSLALVTGASSGIGLALCRLLAEKNIPLIITGRDSDKLTALADELKAQVNVIAFTADLAKAEGRASAIANIYKYQPDLIINNAGFGLYGEVLSYETSDQLDIVNVDASAVLELTLEGARCLLSNKKKGVILNVSSAAALQIFPGMAVYSACKTFVNMISQSFDFEMRPYGIRVLAACPGMVATAFKYRAGGIKKNRAKAPVMTPCYAAEQIWWQIEKEKGLHIFDWKTRLITVISRFIPQTWLLKYLFYNITSRIEPRKPISRSQYKI